MPADAASRCTAIRQSIATDPVDKAIAALIWRERRQREREELRQALVSGLVAEKNRILG